MKIIQNLTIILTIFLNFLIRYVVNLIYYDKDIKLLTFLIFN